MQINLNTSTNSHLININNRNYKIINQLNNDKNISNFYIPKSLVQLHPISKNSYKIKIYDKFICIPKKMCFLDYTHKHYLIGINIFFTYWIYNITDNSKYRLIGYKAIKNINIQQIHFLTIAERRFSKEQINNSFLQSFKNYNDAKKSILKNANKQKEKYRILNENYINIPQKNQNINKKNNVFNKNNLINDYKKHKFKFPALTKQEIKQLLQDLQELN